MLKAVEMSFSPGNANCGGLMAKVVQHLFIRCGLYAATKSFLLWSIVGLFFTTTILSGCSSSEDEELQRYMHEIKTRPSLPIEPIPEFKPQPKFAYPENENRRSPFKPIVIEQTSEQLAPNINRPKQPLEAFPLDALKFVGLLKENGTIWGLISQPGGLISRVKPGDYMGKNFGQILSISQDTMQIEETVQVNGKWEKKKIALKLHVAPADEGGEKPAQ
ncbi:pilus assembly protein PilP [Legionella septentrionalis]|nr:pilus assembly protein PilP [Legionella septentrionalis]